jgi:hypothetical protein
MPNKLLGQFRRMSIYALENPKLFASCRVARIFLGMISCRLTKEAGGSVIYAETFLTINGLGPSTTNWSLGTQLKAPQPDHTYAFFSAKIAATTY